MNDATPDPRQTHNTLDGDVSGAAFQADHVGGDVHITVGRAQPGRPLQVERPPHDFVNQRPLLNWIGESLDPGSAPRVMVCEGPRGIGKTTLIRKIADTHRDFFTGGQLSFEYRRGLYEDVDQAVTGFLRTLGVDANAIPDTPGLRAKEYLTLTREHRLLVVVEGAWEPAQVRALVPGGEGSLVLVSGDGPDFGELWEDPTGAQGRNLVPLNAEHARALLESRAALPLSGEDSESVDHLLKVCAGLPLALVLVGGRLGRMGPGAATGLIADLRHTRSTLSAIGDPRRNLDVIFQTSYEALSDEAATLYRALGDWPGPHLDRELPPFVGAYERLTELVSANLVEVDSFTLRFRHPLIRTHARERAGSEDDPGQRRERLVGMLDAYMVRLGFAELAARGERLRTVDLETLLSGARDPFEGDTEHARSWLLRERPTLLAVVLDSAEQGLHTHAHRFAELATALYLDHRYVHDWATTATVGADSARIAGDVAAEARLCSLGSRPLTDLGRDREVRDRLDRAIELAQGLEDLLLRASVWEFHGRHLTSLDPEAAVAAFDRCVEDNRASDSPRAERGEALGVLGRGQARVRAGQADAAVVDIEDALERLAALATPDDRMIARGRVWLGGAYKAAGRDREAVDALKRAVVELGQGGRHHYQAEAHELLADHYRALGADVEARGHLSEAERIYRGLGSPRARELADALEGAGSKVKD